MKLIHVYYRFGEGEGVILCLYVDDILIFWTSINAISYAKSFFSQSFSMKDLGEVDVILKHKINQRGRIGLLSSNPIMWTTS